MKCSDIFMYHSKISYTQANTFPEAIHLTYYIPIIFRNFCHSFRCWRIGESFAFTTWNLQISSDCCNWKRPFCALSSTWSSKLSCFTGRLECSFSITLPYRPLVVGVDWEVHLCAHVFIIAHRTISSRVISPREHYHRFSIWWNCWDQRNCMVCWTLSRLSCA